MRVSRQIYWDWVLGTLVYMVVLSMFDDYTSVLYISSASIILLTSVVLQALTFWTLSFKTWLGSQFTYPAQQRFRPAKFFALWFVLFSSKFVFLWVLDVIFGEHVAISGFLGLLSMIVLMTVTKEMIIYFDSRLAKSTIK